MQYNICIYNKCAHTCNSYMADVYVPTACLQIQRQVMQLRVKQQSTLLCVTNRPEMQTCLHVRAHTYVANARSVNYESRALFLFLSFVPSFFLRSRIWNAHRFLSSVHKVFIARFILSRNNSYLSYENMRIYSNNAEWIDWSIYNDIVVQELNQIGGAKFAITGSKFYQHSLAITS